MQQEKPHHTMSHSAQAPQTPLEQMMGQIRDLPLWVKQVIYSELRNELDNSLARSTMDAFTGSDALQLLIPKVTPIGKKELEQPSGQVSAGALKLVYWALVQKNIVNICIMNQWTLEDCATALLECIDKQCVTAPTSGILVATIHYLGNRIRLGEYLVKIGRLSVEELDQALRTQRYIEEALDERTGIGNVLINLGYISKEDAEGILFLKEESKKTFQQVVEERRQKGAPQQQSIPNPATGVAATSPATRQATPGAGGNQAQPVKDSSWRSPQNR
ncbi:MAG: hypothetical protein SFZ03_01555 [Candidatus Melainabacteria bacterium]|nr:hypothetical protein [Candidatus Melainabacteria bacterium]